MSALLVVAVVIVAAVVLVDVWCDRRRIAWPTFACEDCIGMRDHGCECLSRGASAPGVGPRWWHRILRRVIK